MGRNAILLATAAALLPGLAAAQELTVWDWKSGDPVAGGHGDRAGHPATLTTDS